jgi:uridine kinase
LMTRPVIIGVGGGSGAGKTTIVKGVVAAFKAGEAVVIEHDSYYRDQSHLPLMERSQLNFDHPEAYETSLLAEHLRALRQGQAVDIPTYDYAIHTRGLATNHFEPTRIILVDGILVLASEELRREMDYKVYVEADAVTRLSRRLRRDVIERGRTPQSVGEQYAATVGPMHEQFVAPCRECADLVLSGEMDPEVSIGMLSAKIREILNREIE